MNQGRRKREHNLWGETHWYWILCISQSTLKFLVFWDCLNSTFPFPVTFGCLSLPLPPELMKWLLFLEEQQDFSLKHYSPHYAVSSLWDYKSSPTLNQDKWRLSLTLKLWAGCLTSREICWCSLNDSLRSSLLPRLLGGPGFCPFPFVLKPPCQFYELLGILINLFHICPFIPGTCKRMTKNSAWNLICQLP